MISPFSNASSPGSVGSKVCKARTRVTMFPFSTMAESEVAAAAGVAVVVVVVLATATAGAAEEPAAKADGMEDVWRCNCACGWV